VLGRNHLVFGIGSSALALHYAGFDPVISVVTAPIAGYAALIPDVDHWHSKINSKWWVRLFNLPFILLGKRGVSHSIVALFILLLLGAALYRNIPESGVFVLAFWVGYASHILADMMTSAGVRFFYPLSEKRIRTPLNFATGSIVEYPVALIPIGLFALSL
jgi:inner membrane protein